MRDPLQHAPLPHEVAVRQQRRIVGTLVRDGEGRARRRADGRPGARRPGRGPGTALRRPQRATGYQQEGEERQEDRARPCSIATRHRLRFRSLRPAAYRAIADPETGQIPEGQSRRACSSRRHAQRTDRPGRESRAAAAPVPGQHADPAHRASARARATGHAGRRPRRPPRRGRRAGVRLALVAGRLADGPGRPGGVPVARRLARRASGRISPTCGTTTSSARRSRSRPTTSTASSAATPRSRGSASALRRRGLRLLLDFVPNHVAPDHPWVRAASRVLHRGHRRRPRPRAAATGSAVPAAAACSPTAAIPYFPGWPDTLQLNYRHAGLREAMTRRAARASRSGATASAATWRCWCCPTSSADLGRSREPARRLATADQPFWPEAIARVRGAHPGVPLHGRGLLGPRVDAAAAGLRLHLRQAALRPAARRRRPAGARSTCCADPDFQARSARFLENHDEPRAAAVFGARACTGRPR